MKVAFITPGWQGKPGQPFVAPNAIVYYRCVLPAEGLNRFAPDVQAEIFQGVSSFVATGELRPILATDASDQPLAWDTTGWDLIVLKGWMDVRMADVIRKARAYGQVIVNDIDDHYWALPSNNPARKDVASDWNPEHYREILSASSHITVATPFLADFLSDLGTPVSVIRNMLDLDLWNRQPVQELQTMSWCGHLEWRSHDLETVGSAVRYFLRDHPEVRFVHGGYDPVSPHIGDILKIPKSRIDLRPFRPIEEWPKMWQGFDLTICPLKTTDFNRAKSDLKRLEAAAAGVPAVCTRWDPYLEWEDCTPLVSTPAEWRDALEQCVSPVARQAAVERGYEHADARGIAERWKDWYSLYAELCSRASRPAE